MVDLNNTRHKHFHSPEEEVPPTRSPKLSTSLPNLTLKAGSGSRSFIQNLPPPPSSQQSSPKSGSKQLCSQKPEPALNSEKVTSHSIFQRVEEYMMGCFRHCDCLNESFSYPKPAVPTRSVSEGATNALQQVHQKSDMPSCGEDIFELDAKTLLLGDVAENGSWWLGKPATNSKRPRPVPTPPADVRVVRVGSKSPRIYWAELHRWYQAILTAGQQWRSEFLQDLDELRSKGFLTAQKEAIIDADMTESRNHLRQTLLKATETLLRRPGRPLETTGDCRFLMLLLANPLLYSVKNADNESRVVGCDKPVVHAQHLGNHDDVKLSIRAARSSAKPHHGIVKRMLGLMANIPQESHRHIVGWFSRYPVEEFGRLVDLIGSFVTHRLNRQRRGQIVSQSSNVSSVLVPEVFGPQAGTSAQLHAALGTGSKSANPQSLEGAINYCDDWQLRAAAKIMSLLFLANNNGIKPQGSAKADTTKTGHFLFNSSSILEQTRHPTQPLAKAKSKAPDLRRRGHEQLLPTSAFYNTLLDYFDIIADFEAWENRRGSFTFCQYPMFLSIWAKTRILEHDARRQMEIKARQAFFNSIMNRRAVSQHLVLKVRRECLVEDSLRGISEVVGSGQEDIKKGLKIVFQGEEGVDAGG
ncbi:MAG: hypothetical protein Q9201_001079 [Fulgogasparrea decipioides]